MSDYPELFKEYSEYISLINSLQSKDPASLAAGYWLRWYWVKACGELWTASNKTDSNAQRYLSDQIDIVTKIKNGNPSLADKPGKDLFMKYVAGKRNIAMDLDGRQQYQEALSVYNELILLYTAACKIAPEGEQSWKALSRKTKSRYIEIYKCLRAGTPVPSMPMTNSMIGHGSSSFAPSNMHNSNFPSAPSNPNFPSAPSNPNFFSDPSIPPFPSATNNPNFFSDPSIPPFPSAPSVSSFPQNNLGSPSLPSLPSNPNFPGSVPSFQMGNQERSNSGYSGFGEPSNYYNVAHSEIPMHPDEAQPGLRRSSSSNRDNSPGQTQFEDVQLPGANPNTWGKPSNFPSSGGHQMGMQTNFGNGGHQTGMQTNFGNGGHQTGMQNDYSNNGGCQMGMQTNFGSGGHQMGMQSDSNSNGGNQMSNFGGNRLPSYGENRPQFGMGGNGHPIAGMNYMQDFGGQTTVIQSGLKNRQTGWENNVEEMLNCYNREAEEMAKSKPKLAKAIYEAMINACNSDRRFAGYADTFRQCIANLKM